MHSSHHDTSPAQQQSSEKSLPFSPVEVLPSPQISVQISPLFTLSAKKECVILLAIRFLALPMVISLTILGLASIYMGSCVDAQAGEGNRIRVGCWE